MPMPLVPSYNTKRIFATWVRQGGTEMRPGTYRVSVPVRLTNATDDVIIPEGVYATGSLNTTPGLPSLDIQGPCTDDPDNWPRDWQLRIEITFPDAPKELYVLDVPIAGPDINLRTVIMTVVLPEPEAFLIRGVAGGVAALDAEGDVIDAEGAKVVASGPGGTELTSYETQVADLPDYPTTFPPEIGATATTAVAGNDPRLTNQRVPTDGSVTNAKVATGAAISLDKTADSATRVAMTPAERTKVAGLAPIASSGSASDLTTGTLPTSVLPPLSITDVFPVTSQAEMLALTAQRGDVALRTDLDPDGFFILAAEPASTLANWKQISAPGAVTTVFGRTGAVTAAIVDITGLTAALGERIRWRGPIAANTAYFINDAVPASDGRWARALQDHTSGGTVSPPATTSAFWEVYGGSSSARGTLATMAPGSIYSISYADAIALGSRPTALTDIRVEVYGGLKTDANPAWMIAGDRRIIVGA